MEEKFGPVSKSDADDAKKKSTANAAIPYKYSDEDTIQTDDSRKYLDIKPKTEGSEESDEESEVDFGKYPSWFKTKVLNGRYTSKKNKSIFHGFVFLSYIK